LLTYICSTSDTSCTPESVFQLLRQFPAPLLSDVFNPLQTFDADRPAVNNGDISVLPIGLVVTCVDQKNLSVTNKTSVFHLLYPGTVTRSVIVKDGNIYIDTVGTGSGLLPKMNEKLAPYVWGSVDFQLKLNRWVNGFFQ
jgi:hypothetical protein